ncbi:MAG: sodium:solute symporter [Acidobacteria bacterium]|nr:sodium:solute symporter [Acidobacteriota bacterium]
MRPLDWAVLAASLAFIIAYGLWKSRRTSTTSDYLLAGRQMPWYAMALSIMATQASAITFISTTGQAYMDGMRFVQFYFGLPLAMILISAFVVPAFHGSGVYTAYEYLEQRFDAKTRALVSVIFLIQRGLAVGVALYAPAIVLAVIFGWPEEWTTVIMGVLTVFYTAAGGVKAVTWTDFQQMLIMMAGLCTALIMAVWMLPSDVSFTGALTVAGAAGRLNAVVTSFDWNDRYNVWNGLLGGMFLALAYFGCDQSQVQRYLTGRSIAQSRLSLLFNAVAKIPMQFLILLTGAVVFVFYTFEKPPLLFHARELEAAQKHAGYAQVSERFDRGFELRRTGARDLLAGKDSGGFTRGQRAIDEARRDAARLTGETVNDTNYVFLTFVTTYLPAGVVGLIMAAIFAAAMSTISAEINSLATVSVIDIYRRFLARDAPDRHYLSASRWFTLFWGIYAVATARLGRGLGSLIEAVNQLGSLFYGSMLGVFVVAFLFKRVGGTAAFAGMLVGQAVIFAAAKFTSISFLWFNVIGCLAVVAVALAWPRPSR